MSDGAALVTVDDYLAEFGEAEALQTAPLGGPNTPDGGGLDRSRIEAAIAHGIDRARSTAGQRYAALFAQGWVGTTPAALKGAILDIARYRLRDRSGGQGQVAETVWERYKRALADLEMMRSGKIALDADLPQDGQADPVRRTAFVPPSHRYPATLEGYRV